MIPYIKPTGVVDVRFRSTGQAGEKYLSRPGAEPHIFNTGVLLKARSVIAIAEGELDCITLTQIGIDAVGVPGVTNFKDHWGGLFEGFRRVVVFGDGDDPGIKFAAKMSRRFRGIAVEMPPKMDVNEAFNDPDYGADWLREKVYG